MKTSHRNTLSSFTNRVGPLLALLGLLASQSVSAVPIVFTGSGVLDSSNVAVPGTSPGGTFTLTVIVDNGGSSLLSQAWSGATILSGSLDSGTYHADYLSPQFGSSGFATNAAGLITQAFYADCCISGNDLASDTFGTSVSVRLFSNAFSDSQSRFSFFNGDVLNQQPQKWSVAFTTVPGPATLPLLALGLVGVSYARRRRLQ